MPYSSRRDFLSLSSVVLASAALPQKLFAESIFPAITERSASPLTFTAQTFSPLVNSSFSVFKNHGDAAVSTYLTLLSVSRPEMPAHPVQSSKAALQGPQLDSFSLHFLGTGEILRQGTYEVEHSALGKFPMFIVPSNSGTGRETYTAVYNHVVGALPFAPPTRKSTK